MEDYRRVLDFWFTELNPTQWYMRDRAVDDEIRRRFGDLVEKAGRDELYEWRHSPEGRLAEIILLDQFTRNIYRGSKKAFEHDDLALSLAQEMVELGLDKEIQPSWRAFIYLPYMHSESSLIHEEALKLFSEGGLEENLEYEKLHKEILDRFGRYPHRNIILGRESTPEEIEFLKTHPGF